MTASALLLLCIRSVGSRAVRPVLAHGCDWGRTRHASTTTAARPHAAALARALCTLHHGASSSHAAKFTSSSAMTSDAPTEGSKFRIYTKTGDKGTAALYNGARRGKDDAVFGALGDVDELNSALGLAGEFLVAAGGSGGGQEEECGSGPAPLQQLQQQLEVVQSRLLDVGSAVATPADASSAAKLARVQFPAEATAQLEAWLDQLDDQLPPLKNFILPSGGRPAAHLHMARAVCRRAERSVVPLVREGAVDAQVGVYLNRLSDYLFTAARYAAMREGRPEKVYRKQPAAA